MLCGFFSLYRRICAPPELNIKICNLITSYVALPYIFNANLCIRFFITHFVRQRYFQRIRKLAALTFGSYIIFRRSADPPAHQSCWFFSHALRLHLTLTSITTLTTLTTETKDMKASTTFAFNFNSYNYFNSFNYRNKSPNHIFYIKKHLP